MAKVITRHVKNMVAADIPNGFMQYLQVREPKNDIESYNKYLADHAQWVTDGSDPATEPDAVPHAAVVDEDNPTLGERLFISTRFLVSSDENAVLTKHPAAWAQINDTNFPTLNITAFKQAAKNMHDAQRTFEGLDPL